LSLVVYATCNLHQGKPDDVNPILHGSELKS
jgi:hypothetical protein